jgi:hypothetical protein
LEIKIMQKEIEQKFCQPYTCEEKISTGMEQVAGKPSWHSKIANVHLTKHTVALVYMRVCVCVSPYNWSLTGPM